MQAANSGEVDDWRSTSRFKTRENRHHGAGFATALFVGEGGALLDALPCRFSARSC